MTTCGPPGCLSGEAGGSGLAFISQGIDKDREFVAACFII